jgi:hypothetical protein
LIKRERERERGNVATICAHVMSSQQDEEVADPLEHKFLELKEQLVQVVKQLRKKPNDSLLCRRKEELTGIAWVLH